MLRQAKQLFRSSFLYQYYRRTEHKIDYFNWRRKNRNGPTPHLYKQHTIIEYGQRYNIQVFIETGTYLGDMVYAVSKEFDRIVSIELSKDLYRRALKRFAKHKNIHICHGDSTVVLPEVVRTLTTPALFWLDAHYSGGFSTRGETDTPVLAELNTIFDLSEFNHVILIDDAHLFDGRYDYPTLHALQAFIKQKKPNYVFKVNYDIIRIVPGKDKYNPK
ncbi:MAG: hypothetical protein KKI12_10695 [Proteobacteria bacterium]|nr:hypothetical protein [Pseudomonadota bacterium]MBU4258705.1 hypothetical protein [Pseudomonadota bacterium]MBU4288624.1 hypothetical protein [Pseudomonadota bacterium]